MISLRDYIYEGKLKRSDPVISGDSGHAEPTPTMSSHRARMSKYATLSGKSEAATEDTWHRAREHVDPRLSARWALVHRHFTKLLGLKD